MSSASEFAFDRQRGDHDDHGHGHGHGDRDSGHDGDGDGGDGRDGVDVGDGDGDFDFDASARADESAADAQGEAFAQGLALQLMRWAGELGAPPRLARQLARLGHALARATRAGHVCLPLAQTGVAADASALPALRALGLIGSPQAPAACPLIVDDEGRAYLHRDFALERRLAQRLARAACAPARPLPADMPARLATLFGTEAAAAPDWQQVATALALRQRLLVISGGPGTGKTATVVKLLACLLAQEPQARIALAAPTGKAAARLAEAVRERAATLPAELRARLPQQASTVHRLLGVTPQGFVHHAQHPLALDALVVDEASMLDLALATQLLEALPDSARIVLLGDQHQLAAVESGAVFAELARDPGLSADCRSALEAACALPPGSLQPPSVQPAQSALPTQPTAPGPGEGALPDSVIWFERNYRFAADSPIGRLATQIKHGQTEDALATLRAATQNTTQNATQEATQAAKQAGTQSGTQTTSAAAATSPAVLQWWDEGATTADAALAIHAALEACRQGHAAYLQAVLEAPDDAPALARAFARFRVLCAHRQGVRGAAALNAALDAHAQRALAPLLARHPPPPGSACYVGRPVMVLRNQPLLQLFNGDIGITLPPAAGERGPVVAFAQADGSLRRVPVQRLPEHQSAWAMTVHKAQGSEFDAVLVLLPPAPSPVLTRELLYTAVTRARTRLALAGRADLLAAAMATPTQRHSGLAARLREALSHSTGTPT